MKQVRNYVVQHLNTATCDYVFLSVDYWVFGTPYYWTCFDSWFRAAFPPSSGSAFHKKKRQQQKTRVLLCATEGDIYLIKDGGSVPQTSGIGVVQFFYTWVSASRVISFSSITLGFPSKTCARPDLLSPNTKSPNTKIAVSSGATLITSSPNSVPRSTVYWTELICSLCSTSANAPNYTFPNLRQVQPFHLYPGWKTRLQFCQVTAKPYIRLSKAAGEQRII